MGMVFQEGALFDSFTVGENVGYKLYEETDDAAERGARSGSRKCSGSSGSASTSTRCHRSCRAASAGASPLPAPWRPSRRCCSTTSRRPGLDPMTCADRRRRNRQAARPRARHVDAGDAPVARRVLRRHARGARGRPAATVEVVPAAQAEDRTGRLRDDSGRPGRVRRLGGRTCDTRPTRTCRRFFRNRVFEHMPRTRSLAWAELKFGIIAVFAIAMAAVLIFAVGGGGGFFWQNYPLKADSPTSPASRRLAGPRRRRRGGLGVECGARAGRRRGLVRRRRTTCAARHRPSRWRRSARSRCSAKARWTSPRRRRHADQGLGLRQVAALRPAASRKLTDAGHSRP